MNIKKSKKLKTLWIEDDSGPRELAPGDIYELTMELHMSTEKLSGYSKITALYIWDGKTLKQQKRE